MNDREWSDSDLDGGFFGTEGVDGAEALDIAVVALVEDLMARTPAGREGLLGVLLGVQRAFGRVSWRVQELVADRFDLSPPQVAAVVSYYPELSADWRGRLDLHVCSGPSCHLRGADAVLRSLAEELADQATLDTTEPRLALSTEGCMSVCERAPVIRAGARIHHGIDQTEARQLVESLLESWDRQEPDR